jgi:excinuclease ABC subunit C
VNYSKIKLQIKSLPDEPGVYKYFDKLDNVIYVGKAKNLKKRVMSYFTKNHTHFKTKLLVKQIVKIENIVVESEMDALLLENNLIKKFKPKYNVLLKDDKTYPWICIIKSPRPKVFYTRKIIKNYGEYFGPFTNVKSLKFLIKLIKDIYPFLNHELIHLLKKESKKISVDELEKKIDSIKSLIKGNFKSSIEQFKSEMNNYSSSMEYEKAHKIKEKLNVLYNYQVKSTIVNVKISNTDVYSIYSDESFAYVNYIQISFGAIINSFTLEIKKKMNESDDEILRISIIELRQRFKSEFNLILLPFKINLGSNIICSVPKVGDKKKLIELSLKNAKSYRMERFKQIKIIDPERHAKRIMSQMKSDLKLSEEPYHIECFDNSNIQGLAAVSACVVFKKGKPSKKEYRHYNIKTVIGANDFASMEEVVFRRYKRLLNEDLSLPQLIIIDGGKGQLSSSVKSLNLLGLKNKIAIIGIAKKLEEIYFPNDPIPLYLNKKSETLKIIQLARDEAHRFGINFHRKKRNKSTLISELDNISGIGPKIYDKLIKKFKSVKRLKSATLEEIISVVGKKRGETIYKSINVKNT